MARTNLTKAKRALIGMKLPEQEHGNNGKIIEGVLIQHGYDLNPNKGTDLSDVEVKSRSIDATSAQTVGSMSKDNIMATPYDSSSIKEKFQTQFRVKYRKDIATGENVIISAEEYDFSIDTIQDRMRAAYEHGRQQIIQYITQGQEVPDYISGAGQCGYWERTKKGNCWEFRMTTSTMTAFENIAKVNENPLFELEAA
jgi:hypothetical protein